MQTLYQTLLVLHIASIAIAIGMTLANFIAFKQFWKLYASNKEQGILAFRGINKFNLFGMLSLFLAILTGIAMLWVVQWTFGQLLWFKIKMALVALLFLNGFTMGRINNEKLRKLISATKTLDKLPDDVAKLKRNLAIFQSGQLVIFLLIIFMVVFKFT